MKTTNSRVAAVVALLMIAGCATTKVADRRSDIGNERLPKPDHIYVYNFAATAEELATAGTVASSSYTIPKAPRTPEELAAAHALSDAVARELANEIKGLGLPAEVATQSTTPETGDIVILGHFESIEEGSTGKRVVLGFGSGSAELRTAVQVYQMTEHGLRELGSGTIDSGGTKGPGLIVPLAVTVATANPIGLVVMGGAKLAGEGTGRSTIEGNGKRTADKIATELEAAFKRQGWI